MDAVAEARLSVGTALDAWAKDGKTLIASAKTLGVDTDRFAGMFGGTLPTTGRIRARRGRPARTTNGIGGTVTPEKLLDYLQSGSYNQTQLAKHFHTTPQTIARKLEQLGGQATMVRSHGQKFWTAAGGVFAGTAKTVSANDG